MVVPDLEHDGQLDRIEARTVTDLIRISLGNALDWVADAAAGARRAWAGRADLALGYHPETVTDPATGTSKRLTSWQVYCREEFAAVRATRLPVPMRVELEADLADAGMSMRAIAAFVGVDEATTRADLRAAGQRVRGDAEAVTLSPATDAAPTLSKAERIVAALVAAGSAGLTVHELEAKAKRARWPGSWHHGATSGALSRDVVGRGRGIRTSVYRGGAAVHMHPEHAA